MLGVFGLTQAREDDLLRACRTALAACDVDTESRLEIAVEVGDVLAGGGAPARGGILSAVQRLPGVLGSVVLGARAFALLGAGAVSAEPVGGVVVLRAVNRGAEAIARDHRRPLVGRRRELELLTGRFEQAREEGEAWLATIVGHAGIGKSRLVEEVGRELAERAQVVRVRCLSDETGIALAQLAALARELVGRGRAALLGIVAAEDDGEDIVSRVFALAGYDDELSVAPEDVSRALRKVVVALAQERPMLLVVDDLHWADPVFLDFVEELAGVEAPLLVVGAARPELLEHRPVWAAADPRATTVVLAPLAAHELGTLLDLIRPGTDDVTRERILDVSAGNPLFLEQLLAAGHDWLDTGGDTTVPTSLRGLLLARFDRLGAGDATVLRFASVIGDAFAREDLDSLTGNVPSGELDGIVDGLVDGEFLRRTRGGGLAFAHALIRATVYDTLPKLDRATAHERVAADIERRASEHSLDDVLGHHLERAFLLRLDLDAGDPLLPELARRAREHLTAAGRRRLNQGDVVSAVNLLTRARSSTAPGQTPEPDLLLDLGDAFRETGRLELAEEVLGEAAEAAFGAGEETVGWRAQASLVRVRLQLPGHSLPEVQRLLDATLDKLSELDDKAGLAVAWWARGWTTWLTCQAAATEHALMQAMAAARAIDNVQLEAHSVNLYLGAALFGPMSVDDAVTRCLEVRRRHHDRQRIVASSARALAVLYSMRGEFEEARRLVATDRAILGELGMRYQAATAVEAYGHVELNAGDAETAERVVRSGYLELERMGDTSSLPTVGALLGETLVALGRYEEALEITDHARQHADDLDLAAQVQWRTAQARALAGRGRHARAQRVARDAVALAARTDFLQLHGEALLALGEVDRLMGRFDTAARAFAGARGLFKQKGSLVALARCDVAIRTARRLSKPGAVRSRAS